MQIYSSWILDIPARERTLSNKAVETCSSEEEPLLIDKKNVSRLLIIYIYIYMKSYDENNELYRIEI